MVLVRQPKPARFRPIAKYNIFVDQLSRCMYSTCQVFVFKKVFNEIVFK